MGKTIKDIKEDILKGWNSNPLKADFLAEYYYTQYIESVFSKSLSGLSKTIDKESLSDFVEDIVNTLEGRLLQVWSVKHDYFTFEYGEIYSYTKEDVYNSVENMLDTIDNNYIVELFEELKTKGLL